MEQIPEPERREIPEAYKLKNSEGLMQTVRTDIKQTILRPSMPGAVANAPVANAGMLDDIMDKVDCSVWRKFDALRAQGALKKKVLFFTLDGSDIVEGFLKKIFGARPAGCL